MSNENLCKLCQTDQVLKIDHEKASYKSANNLLQTLFNCYNIDVSILKEGPCTCKQCFEEILQISEQLEKWSNAQKVLQKDASLLEKGDAVISIKEEPLSLLWDENDDAEFLAEDNLELLKDETDKLNDLEYLDEEEPQKEDLEFIDEKEPQAEDLEFLEEDEPQTEDVESFKNHAEGVSAQVYGELFGIQEAQVKSRDPLHWRLIPHEFFCVCLGPDGLALAVLFKDKSPQRNIRMLCTCCNQVFATVSDIQKHSLVSRAHPEYWCRCCGIYFPSITDLKFHEEYQKHQLVTSGLVIRCLKCAKISTQFINAIRHENTVHDRISCKKCNLSFHSRESLAKHQYMHKIHVCCYPNCQQKFKVWQQYVNHLNWHKRLVSRCPVPGCSSIMMPGDHVKHLRKHSKNQIKFYDGVGISLTQGAPYLINQKLMGTRKA